MKKVDDFTATMMFISVIAIIIISVIEFIAISDPMGYLK
jgi:hypothetical protein